jgi:XTP/dITP diphosphohydrolase
VAWHTLLVATTNDDKVAEIRNALAHVPITLVGLSALPPIPEPEETGRTFLENARLKALYYGAHRALPTLADDSGLAIDALDGEPGVESARFLGAGTPYAVRFAEIERRLRARRDAPRTGRFICAVAVAFEGRVVFETTAAVEGTIAERPAGTNGFGYDPIFFYPPYGATLAQVSLDDKMRVSHRGAALRRVAEWLIQG